MPFALPARAQLITAGRSGGVADGVEYRNQFLRLPLNPNIESTFVGVSNYAHSLSDPGFWHSLWMTVWYTALVVAGSTVAGWPWRVFSTASSACAKTARSLRSFPT